MRSRCIFLLVVLELLCFAPAWTGQVRPVRNKTLHSFGLIGCGDGEKEKVKVLIHPKK